MGLRGAEFEVQLLQVFKAGGGVIGGTDEIDCAACARIDAEAEDAGRFLQADFSEAELGAVGLIVEVVELVISGFGVVEVEVAEDIGEDIDIDAGFCPV